MIKQFLPATAIATTFKGSVVLDGFPPARFSRGNVTDLVRSLLRDAGRFHLMLSRR